MSRPDIQDLLLPDPCPLLQPYAQLLRKAQPAPSSVRAGGSPSEARLHAAPLTRPLHSSAPLWPLRPTPPVWMAQVGCLLWASMPSSVTYPLVSGVCFCVFKRRFSGGWTELAAQLETFGGRYVQSKRLHCSLLAGKVSPGLCRKGLGGGSESHCPDQEACARRSRPRGQRQSPQRKNLWDL